MEKGGPKRRPPLTSKFPDQPPPKPPFAAASAMDAKQIIDKLPLHISLDRNSSLTYNPPPSTADRSAILKWFSTLSPPQRISHLTIVDYPFTQLLLRHCHSTFIALPDIPTSENPQIPSLCSRKSQGLLARVAESDDSAQLFCSSIRLFSSREGVDPPSCDVGCLDTASFCEGFVEYVGSFVEAMDSVTDSGFLNGGSGWAELESEWVELGWLKAKGYYSMEAFVVNRMEVALRLAWLNSNNSGKERGVKLKEKASNAAGIGANVYWRKKGCIDWWEKLDVGLKKRAFQMVLKQAAKSLMQSLGT